jgi:hypothetical protein
VTSPSGDLSTILWRCGPFSVTLDPRNFLGGLRFDPGAVVVHVAVFGVRWQWRKPDGPGQAKAIPDGSGRPEEWLPGQWR